MDDRPRGSAATGAEIGTIRRPPTLSPRQRVIRDPADVSGYLGLVAELGLERQNRSSETLLRRALVIDPIHAEANEVVFFLDRNPGDRALSRMRRCLAVNPRSFRALMHGGIHMRNREDVSAAETLLKRAAAVNPKSNLPWDHLWKVQSKWGWNGRGVVGSVLLSEKFDDSSRFFRKANTRFFPHAIAEFDDLETILKRDIFHGYLPATPLIRSDQPIIAMGSCFAQHIRQFLIRHGRLSEHVPIPEGLNNTFAIRQFVDWVEGRDDLVYSYEKASGGGMARWDVDKDRDLFRRAIANSGGFVVTVGVAEVWRDRLTGGVFWRGIPEDRFDPDRHEHKLSTVEQNAENLRAVAAGLRRIAGDVPVVLTLSPVPLVATMREGTSIFAADAVSKSTLRLAIETVLSDTPDLLRYWPSFEAFRWLGGHLRQSLYDGENNPRHPNTEMIGRIVDLFVRSYFEPRADDEAAISQPVLRTP